MKRLFLVGIVLLLPVLCFARSGTKATNQIQVIEVEVEKVKYIYEYKIETITIPIEKFVIEGVEIIGDTKTNTIKVTGIDPTSVITSGNTVTLKPKKQEIK